MGVKISIALATYNGAAFLQDQLDSYRAQERAPDEVVVCDDASTDDTLEILEAFKNASPFQVRIERNQRNLGFTKNFEKVLSNCSGDLILLSDQDDVWFPGKVGGIEDAFQKNPDKHLLVHDGELVDEELVSHGATKLGQIMAGYGAKDSLITGALTAMRRTYLSVALPIPEGIVGHDAWLHHLGRLLETRIVLDHSLQLIRRHSSNTSSWVASSTRKINRRDVWVSQARSPVASGYEDRIIINEASRERLSGILAMNRRVFSPEVIANSLGYLASERKALDHRNELPKADFLGR